MRELVCGFGVNDADYVVKPTVNGKQVKCPFYTVWKSMLERCYSEEYLRKRPSYRGCFVCSDWLYFTKFKKWMQSQPWHGKQIDKDLIVDGNKEYSPYFCAFVSQPTNSFATDRKSNCGELPVGVDFHSGNRKFQARCSNPFSGKRENLGYFNCPKKAHEAWRSRKHELALQLADLQSDPRVSAALRVRYLKQQGENK